MSPIEASDTFGTGDPPARETNNEQYLFLLEFFVYRVCGERLAKLNGMFFVPTRVAVKFLNFEDEETAVTPVDPAFEPRAGIGNDVENFNSGRSVMFAIDRASVLERTMDFKIDLRVEKKMPEDTRPDIPIGTGEIDMSKHFAALRKEMIQCGHTDYPPPKVFEGRVDLRHEDRVSGSLEIYVRLSGFGQSIVTEIETPSSEEKSASYVFKSARDDDSDKRLAYSCRPISSSRANLRRSSGESGDACPVCLPRRYDCSPCGTIGGAGVRPTAEKKRSEEALKKILDGKIFAQPWDPNEASGASPVHRANDEQLRRFQEQARSIGLPIQSSRGPAELCGRAVVLKVSGLLDVDDADGRRKNPTVTVAGKSGSRDADPEHDVFILRIGKKGLVGEGEKSDIQVEMRTPRGPERRPPIRYETREMQTDEDELESPTRSLKSGPKKKAKTKRKGKNKKKRRRK